MCFRYSLLSLVAFVVGCGEATDPRIAEFRAKFLVTEAPDNPLSIADVSELLKERAKDSDGEGENAADTSSKPEPREVALIGRISAGDLEPWDTGKASFIVSDLPAEGHGKGHDADNCPFCKRRAAGLPTTIVRFVDDQGQTIPIDAQKLLGVKKDQHVIVHGTAKSPESKTIEVIADRIYLFGK